MPVECQQGIFPVHAHSVVAHANERASSVLELDGDAHRAGIEGILHQLLDHRRRSLDDLSGRDLVGHLSREYGDSAHQRRAISVRNSHPSSRPRRTSAHAPCSRSTSTAEPPDRGRAAGADP
jgi:hypothetical protein